MDATLAELERDFDARCETLISELEDWFEEETASIDGTVESQAPKGLGGSIMGTMPAIDSKRVVDATIVTKQVLGIELPPEIIKPGGYSSCEEMIADIVPKLKKVFTGVMKVKTHKPTKLKQAA